MLILNKMIDMLDHENDMTITSSPIKLIEGGRARLVRLVKSDKAAIRGKIICKPRAKIMIRLWTCS